MSSLKASPASPSKRVSATRLIRVPLTAKEHSLLSMPPQVSIVKVGEGQASAQDIWTLWTRAHSTLLLVQRHHAHVLEELQPLVAELHEYFIDKLKTQSRVFTMSAEMRSNVNVILDLADEVQKETNREYILLAYQDTDAYGKKLAQKYTPKK